MRCKGCGGEISSNHLYCTHCGMKNEQEIPTYAPGNNKTKHKILIPMVIGAVVLLAIMGILVLSTALRIMNHLKIAANDQRYIGEDYYDISDIFDSSDDVMNDDTYGDEDLFTYSLKYSYTEQPDAVSIDSDERFIFCDHYIDNEVITYVYQFQYSDLMGSDIYTAINDYGSLLMSESGYSYEEDINNDTIYYTKDNVAIGITAREQDTGWYAYIDIYYLSDDEGISSTEENYPNYSYYLENRDVVGFEQYSEVVMENMIGFNLNDVMVTDLGDGTAQVDCNMDISAYAANISLYTDDLLIVPMNHDGSMLSDACLIEYVIDGDGNYISAPCPLASENYNNYTVSFIVPAKTAYFTFYGTNITSKSYAGPAYFFDMYVD